MSVSRGPIREACRRLEQAGLVEIFVNRGVFVRKLSPEDAAELCDIRAVLSGYAGRLLAQRVSDEQLAQLKQAVLRMEAHADEGDVGGFYPLNAEFHATLFKFAGNARLAKMYAAISKELNLFRWRALMISSNLGMSVTEHREILAALEDRDPGRAAEAMETHALSVKNRLLGSGLGD
jgi:DNA-binding GntR family transcriptional regulator